MRLPTRQDGVENRGKAGLLVLLCKKVILFFIFRLILFVGFPKHHERKMDSMFH